LILGIGDLDPVAKEAKDKGIAVAHKPVERQGPANARS
jgi:hypothetical protein